MLSTKLPKLLINPTQLIFCRSALSSHLHMRQFSTALQFKAFERTSVASPPKCTYPAFEDPEPEPVFFTEKTRNIPYSSKRLNECAKEVRGKHITDAISAAEKLDKKGGPVLLELLQKVKEAGVKQGLNPDMFYVKEAFVGKGFRSKMIDIKARGKMGIIQRPKSSLTVVMQEKPINHVVKDALMGNTPPGIGEVFRKRLLESNADFEDLRKYSFMITSKGRSYRRQQFKRLVELARRDYEQRGIHLREKQIVKYMLEKQMQMIIKDKKEKADIEVREKNLERQTHFEKNYEKKK